MSIEHSSEHQPLPPEDDPLSLEFITRRAKELTLRDGFHSPTLIAVGSASAVGGQFDEMPDNHPDRVRMMHAAGQSLGEQDALGALQQVVFITEAWMRLMPRDVDGDFSTQNADRIEVLCIARLSLPEQAHELVLLEMQRDAHGELVDLQDYQLGDDGDADSPLLRAFAQGYRTARARRTN